MLRLLHVLTVLSVLAGNTVRTLVSGAVPLIVGDKKTFKNHAMPTTSDKVLKAVHLQNCISQLLGDHFKCQAEYGYVDVLPSAHALPKALRMDQR